MNKIYGSKSDYAPVKREGTQIVVCYGYEAINKEEGTWYEVSLPAANYPLLSFADVKDAILGDINARTDEKIISGFVWTPAAGGDPIPVWLSTENQFNFKSAYDLAVQKNGATLPVTFKMGEQEDGTPVYHTFNTMEDADDFYIKAIAYINLCLAQGWEEKDGIDWEPYKALFPEPGQSSNVGE